MVDGAASVRRCIGSAKFGIEAHEAPVDDFPVQPSQKDGLGQMCKEQRLIGSVNPTDGWLSTSRGLR